jgi:hypothetical protein
LTGINNARELALVANLKNAGITGPVPHSSLAPDVLFGNHSFMGARCLFIEMRNGR